jgi:hypothetical protein
VDPSTCVVLVPVGSHVEPGCERGLQALERRGYEVRRVPGFSAIDFGRCVMAADALRAGFEELMWVDADVAFDPDDVDKLRSHGLPFVCGLYAKKGRREFACDFLPGTERVIFGAGGGLLEVRFAGLGFALTRRAVYDDVRRQLKLPECNQRFGPPIVPWFIPMLARDGPGLWYLAEDYSFCERARLCGHRVVADTTVRLYHIGAYGYSWEDAGSDKERYGTYTFRLAAPNRPAGPAPPHPAAALTDGLARTADLSPQT